MELGTTLGAILLAILGGGLSVTLASRVFSKADKKRDENASIFSKQIDDGDKMRASLLDRVKDLELTVRELMTAAVENERLKARIEDLAEEIERLRERHAAQIGERDTEIKNLQDKVSRLTLILEQHDLRFEG